MDEKLIAIQEKFDMLLQELGELGYKLDIQEYSRDDNEKKIKLQLVIMPKTDSSLLPDKLVAAESAWSM